MRLRCVWINISNWFRGCYVFYAYILVVYIPIWPHTHVSMYKCGSERVVAASAVLRCAHTILSDVDLIHIVIHTIVYTNRTVFSICTRERRGRGASAVALAQRERGSIGNHYGKAIRYANTLSSMCRCYRKEKPKVPKRVCSMGSQSSCLLLLLLLLCSSIYLFPCPVKSFTQQRLPCLSLKGRTPTERQNRHSRTIKMLRVSALGN